MANCLGMHSDLQLSCCTIPCCPHDRFVLCSDGVTQSLTEARILQCLNDAPNAHEAVQRLIRESLCKGGHDNITAAVVIL